MAKRILSVLMIVLMLTLSCACTQKTAKDDKISVVCTTFAAYDWVREIAGDNIYKFDITLLGGGVDLHSFQPSAEDIAKIHTADLFVKVGGATEDWTERLNIDSERTLRLFDLLDDSEKLSLDGHHHIYTKAFTKTVDEHIWLSLRLAVRMVDSISKRICDLDKEDGVGYQKNAAEYIERLKNLDKEYKAATDSVKDKTVIFADRFPFVYLMKDYGILAISAFDGCSSDMNASFETIAHLASEVRAHNKDTVLVLENSEESVAKPLDDALLDIALNKAVIDSCQSINKDAVKSESYIDIMTQNLKSLKMALGG